MTGEKSVTNNEEEELYVPKCFFRLEEGVKTEIESVWVSWKVGFPVRNCVGQWPRPMS